MAEERFPRKKYLNMLFKMRMEMRTWSATYGSMAQGQSNEWLAGNLKRREEGLDAVAEHLDEARWILEQMPRTS